jgi:HAD superfamily hydrolase (TIGR01509 family)
MRLAFQAIIFDFDGVIADSEVISNRELARALTAIGLPTSFEECLAVYYGRNWVENERRIVDRLGKALPEGFTAALQVAVDQALVQELAPVPGVREFVARCAGLPIAIASSSDHTYLSDSLLRFGMGPHFGNHLYSAAALQRGKPFPDIYLMAAAGLGATPATCLVIEDSPVGVQAGAAAGMTVVGLLAGQHIFDKERHGANLLAAGASCIVQTFEQIDHMLVRT